MDVSDLCTKELNEVLCRLVVVAAGAAAGKFLHYEEAAPAVAAQTAYGIEAEVEGYEDSYDGESMLFMDFRRHHTGVWPQTADRYRISTGACRQACRI